MKTFLKIFLVLFLVIMIALISIPMVFKGEIMQKLKAEVNNNVKAQIDWTDFSASLFRGFPDLKITLNNLSVVGMEKFEGDTLVAFDKFIMNIDLISIFSKQIKIKSIIMDKPVVRAIILADGSVNWDIMYPSEEALPEEPVDTTDMAMTFSLKKFEVNSGSIAYIDKELEMDAWLEGVDFSLSGDFSEIYSDLIISSLTKYFTVNYEGIKYINKASLKMDAVIAADLNKYEFTFSESDIKLNELLLGLDGMFGMPNDDDIVFDISFFAKESSFKSVLSMVPAIYAKDFEGLETTGTMNLQGTAKGLINDSEYPNVDISLQVKDGYFAYPDMPKAVEKVNVDMNVFYDGVFEDNSTVNVSRFYMEIADNPVDVRFRMITPISDMQLNGAVKGRFDLATFTDAIPMEDMNLAGKINVDIELMGKMSDIEKENYEAFKADGLLEVKDLFVSGGDIPVPVKIMETNMSFSPKYVHLNIFNATIGHSDIQMKGRMENFIPYVFSDEKVSGSLDLTSSFLNLNELMMDTEEDTASEETDIVLSVIEVPKNIHFIFSTRIEKLLYDKLDVTNILGKITARDGKLIMDNLSMGLLQGSMIMNGEYNTADIKTPEVNFNFNMNSIDIPSAFHAFNTVEKLAPVAEYCKGNISLVLNITSFLDSTMYPVMSSVTGKGRLRSDEVEIIENNTFDKISQLLKHNNMKNPKFKDVNLSFEMRNGRVYIDPFDTRISTTQLNIGGDQGIDQTMNYFINMSIPRSEFGSAANDVLENLTAQATAKGFDVKAGDNVNVQLKIKGSFTDPEISMDVKESMQKAKTEVIEAVQERIQEEAQKVKEDVTEKISEEVDRIMSQAEEEAEKIRISAKEAGEKMVGEAQLQGRNLIKEAGTNPLKKIAAQKAAEEMEKKAKQQADNLNKGAEQQAEKILENARTRVNSLKNN